MVPAGNTFGVPYFKQNGANLTFPDECDCFKASGQSDACDTFDFLVGVIVYDYMENQVSFLSF